VKEAPTYQDYSHFGGDMLRTLVMDPYHDEREDGSRTSSTICIHQDSPPPLLQLPLKHVAQASNTRPEPAAPESVGISGSAVLR
jgi:hypothetical protein